MGNAPKKDLQDISIELRLTSRQMEKQAQKLEAQEKAEKKRIRDVMFFRVLYTLQALDKGQMENAKIYAENVIRNRKEALNLRRFGVKMGALSAKLESAYRTQEVSKQIAESIPMLKKCMKDMDSIGVSGKRNLTLVDGWKHRRVREGLRGP